MTTTALGIELEKRVGETARYVAPEEFGIASGRYFARAVDDRHPLYFVGPESDALAVPGPILPPTLIFETNQFTDLPLDEAGGAGHVWFEEKPGVRSVRGGNSYVWHRDVRPTDRVTVTFSLSSLKHSETRDGHPRHAFTQHIEYADAAGELIAEQDETMIMIELNA
jgi:hypothetical protein